MQTRNFIRQRNYGRRNPDRRSVRLFNLHFQLYFVTISFLGLMYLEPIVSPPVWPFYAAAGWGLLLMIQFIYVFRKQRKMKVKLKH
ncbi:MAG: hypothetical protein DI535_17800 [Citrobacter freundii]|nr:MAG: hypothetical protein DI535_17800 [Citrobacter freundii]